MVAMLCTHHQYLTIDQCKFLHQHDHRQDGAVEGAVERPVSRPSGGPHPEWLCEMCKVVMVIVMMKLSFLSEVNVHSVLLFYSYSMWIQFHFSLVAFI